MALIEPEVITEIASQLKVPATYIFDVMVKAQPIIGMKNICLLAIFLITTVISLKYFWNKFEFVDDDIMEDGKRTTKKVKRDENETIFFTAICVVVFVGIISIVLLSLSGSLDAILLPEYTAIQEVARFIR